jgi:hypothetical protein
VLIKATRIRTATGANELARHLTRGDDNEAIIVVRGTVADLHDAVADAKRFNRVYALRHFIIAPEIAMDPQQFERAAMALADEFGFDPELSLVVEHQKARAVAGVSDRHWHLVVAETNPATGRVLSNSFSHPRHEKVARLLELEFGHPLVTGAHDVAVLAALRNEGRTDLAARLSDALGHGPKPVAAYTTEAHQAGKRHGLDLAQARQHIRAAWAGSADGDGFRTRLAAHGLELAAGEKRGVIVIRDTASGTVLGAANRLAGVRRADFDNLLERKPNDHDHSTERSECRPDAPAGHSHSEARPDHHSGTGKGDGIAPERREGVSPRHDDRIASDDRERGGAEPAGHRGSASEAQRTGHRERPQEDDRRGLTVAIATAAAALFALSKTGIGQSQTERTRQHLTALETQARAKIAAAEANPETAASNRMHAARLYRDGTHAQHAEVLRAYRAALERLAAYPEPRRTFADRLLGRLPDNSGIRALEHEVAAARAHLVAAEKTASGADAHLAWVDRTERAQRTQYMAQAEVQRRAGQEMLAEVVMAQRMVKVFPALAYTGPAFTAWSGGKVERKRRRGLRDPWARNMWGLPIDFG